MFGNSYLKIHIFKLSGLRVYSGVYGIQTSILCIKLQNKDIQYLRNKNTYLRTLCIQDHSYCSMNVLSPVIML